mmetsp:Transcript_24469/g.28501  ORF Transcript_24469/g.28501 Transcript_24469/m.28501 type:complete len:208 (+) Transcript_24469:44-667(+)
MLDVINRNETCNLLNKYLSNGSQQCLPRIQQRRLAERTFNSPKYQVDGRMSDFETCNASNKDLESLTQSIHMIVYDFDASTPKNVLYVKEQKAPQRKLFKSVLRGKQDQENFSEAETESDALETQCQEKCITETAPRFNLCSKLKQSFLPKLRAPRGQNANLQHAADNILHQMQLSFANSQKLAEQATHSRKSSFHLPKLVLSASSQ